MIGQVVSHYRVLEKLGPGLVRAIERDLEPCLGRRWLKGMA